MIRFFAIFLLITATAGAEEVILDEYQCAIAFPGNDRWQRSFSESVRLPTGDRIFSASRADARQLFAICRLPNMPTDDITSPTITSMILEDLAATGSKSGAPTPYEQDGIHYQQFVGARTDPGASDLVTVARATMHNHAVYLLIMIGRAGENPAADKQFTRVLDSFHFVEPVVTPPVKSDPLFHLYEYGGYACGAAAVLLMLLFAISTAATHRRPQN